MPKHLQEFGNQLGGVYVIVYYQDSTLELSAVVHGADLVHKRTFLFQGQRQGDHKTAAKIWPIALCENRTAMQFNQAFDNRQSHTQATF